MSRLSWNAIITAGFCTAPFFAMAAGAMPASNLGAANLAASTDIESAPYTCDSFRCPWRPAYLAPPYGAPTVYPCRRPGWYGQGQGWCGHWNGMELYGGWFRGRWYGGWLYTGSWRYREGW